MENLTLEQMPKAITKIMGDLEELKELVSGRPSPKELSRYIGVDEAAALLRKSKATIYSKCSRRELPFFKSGKALMFDRDELLEMIRSGRKKTLIEMKEDVSSFIKGGQK